MTEELPGKFRLTRRQALIGTMGLLAMPALATRARAATHTELAEAAKQEGALTIYTGANVERQAAISEGFTRRYGIQVQALRLLGAELDHKVQAERTANQNVCDVMAGTSPLTLRDFMARGWLMNIPDDERSSVGVWPEALWNGYWADAISNVHGVAYQTELVPEDKRPKVWDDLLDPFWTGNLLLLDPATGVQSLLMYDLLLKEKGADFLKALRKQGELSASAVPGLQAMGAGAAFGFLPTIPPPVQTAKATGLPIELAFLDLKSRSGIFIAALADCPHPNAAKLYVDYTMTVEGQSFLNGGGGFSAIPDVPDTRLLPDNITPPDYDHSIAHADEIIAALK